MKKFKIVALMVTLITLSACATSPKIMNMGNNRYVILGESEFDYNGMIQGVYEEANNKCDSLGKEMVVAKTHTGYGSTGLFASKRGFQLSFECK
jgi:major membrane immunogen (membrane-anchored lipoprotein)